MTFTANLETIKKIYSLTDKEVKNSSQKHNIY